MSDLQIASEVFEDLAKARTWYALQAEELSPRFSHEFHAGLSKIIAGPLLYPCVYQQWRRVLLESFPYVIYFRLHREVIFVALLFHTSRNPKTARRLLRQRKFEL